MPISATGTVKSAQAQVKAQARQRGYTLVEILVVLVIVGILSGLIMVRVGSFGAPPPSQQLDQLATSMASWCEQAVFQNRDLALRITRTGYDFWLPDYRGDNISWREADSGQFAAVQWHGDVAIDLLLQGQPARLDVDQPQLRCHASSQMTPFTLQLGSGKLRASLLADSNGQLRLID